MGNNRICFHRITYNDAETGLSYFGARYYDSDKGIWLSVDPMLDWYPHQSSYAYCSNNPISKYDPNGMWDDWVESASGKIYWDDNATSQATTKEGEKYLGKNVLVATHNRDADLNEPINTARFDLYLESDKTGPTATISGNTVPADASKFGTLAEGIYTARFQGRASYIKKGIKDFALIINEGKSVPTSPGSPKSSMTEIFFHKGNSHRESLSTLDGHFISVGCQTGPSGKGSSAIWNTFAQKLKGFSGTYYLRKKPQILAPVFPAIDSSLPGINILKRW